MKYFLKLFTLWAFLINSVYGQGDPAPFVKGIGSTGLGNSASTILVPNQQSTKINAYQALIETGNKNLLINPSFEHSIITTGWTILNATGSKVSGPDKNALRLTLTGALSILQDSTLNAANLVGLQGLASIKIKTSTVDGLKVCARNDGTTSSTLCVNVPKDGAWKDIQIPYILTATSNGIVITSTGTTGTIDLDDAFVGLSSPFQNVNGARLMGTVTITGCSTAFSTASSTFVDLPSVSGCTYTTTGQALQPSTNMYAIKFASLPAGDYMIQSDVKTYSSASSSDAVVQFWDGVNTAREFTDYITGTGASGFGNISQSISYSTNQSNVTLSMRAKVSSTGVSFYAQTGQPAVIKLWYFPPESKIYSQASQDYDWTAYTPTFTGFGSVASPECFHKREGSDLLVRCKFTSGTSTATEARVSLPSGLTSASSSIIPSISKAGSISWGSTTASSFELLIEPGVSYFTIGVQNASNAGLTKAQGSVLLSSGTSVSIQARIPIQGWQDYGVIVGSFAGIEKCSDDFECSDSLSATVTCSSSSSIVSQNLNWISSIGNISTGNCSVTLVSGIFTNVNYTCNATWNAGNTLTSSRVTSKTTTSFTLENKFQNGATTSDATSATVDINCVKSGQDYKPKTAKVATSIGVPTVPGITTTGAGNLIDTFSFSYGTTNATTVCSASPCSYLDQIGTGVTSVTRGGTGSYTANFSKTYAKLKCSFYCMGGVVCGSGQALSCSNCSSLSYNSYNTSTFGIQDSFGLLMCQGSY